MTSSITDLTEQAEVLAIGEWSTNAELIEQAVAPMGYLSGRVLDMTYNTGKFWKRWRPAELVTNDLDPEMPSEHHQDARSTTWATGDFDSVVIDLPYKLAGKPSSPEMDRNYGTTEYRSRQAVIDLHRDACAEGARLSRRYVLVKTADQVNAGAVCWLTDEVTFTMATCGMRKVTAYMLLGGRPQPATNPDGSPRRQLHPRNNYSTLLVFERVQKPLGPFGGMS